MTENIRVTCLIDRYWDPETMSYDGTESAGTLIEISVQSAEADSGKISTVGVVMLDDGTFQSIPIEFIQKEEII